MARVASCKVVRWIAPSSSKEGRSWIVRSEIGPSSMSVAEITSIIVEFGVPQARFVCNVYSMLFFCTFCPETKARLFATFHQRARSVSSANISIGYGRRAMWAEWSVFVHWNVLWARWEEHFHGTFSFSCSIYEYDPSYLRCSWIYEHKMCGQINFLGWCR